MLLKSTKQPLVIVPWTANTVKPWDDGYQRVIIITPKHHNNSVQIVRDDHIISSEE